MSGVQKFYDMSLRINEIFTVLQDFRDKTLKNKIEENYYNYFVSQNKKLYATIISQTQLFKASLSAFNCKGDSIDSLRKLKASLEEISKNFDAYKALAKNVVLRYEIALDPTIITSSTSLNAKVSSESAKLNNTGQ
jgi:hypothetical protein